MTNETHCDEIAKIIMDEYEAVLIERMIKTGYDFLEDYEKERVAEIAKDIAKTARRAEFPTYEERYRAVTKAVGEYLKTNDLIVPGGFVDFRMRELYYYASAIADIAADMFFEEREYEEFTYLLKLFISEKESREEILHLVWNGDEIRLINKRGRDVSEKYEKEFYSAAKKKGIGKEDIAISAVISAAPKKLVFHNAPEKSPLKETLLKIFEGRCRVCTGCNICKNS